MDGILVSSKKVWKKTETEHDRVNDQHGWHTTNTSTQMQNLFWIKDMTSVMASFHSDQNIHYTLFFFVDCNIYFVCNGNELQFWISKKQAIILLLMKCTVQESTCCSPTPHLFRVLTASLLWDKLSICIQTEMGLRHFQEITISFWDESEIRVRKHFENWDENQNFPYWTNCFIVITIYNTTHFSHCTETEVYYLHLLISDPFSMKICHKKGKVVLVLIWFSILWRRMREWRYSPIILDLYTRWRWLGSFMLLPLYPWYPLYRRLGGPQSRSGHCGEEENLAAHPAACRNKRLSYPDS
jgi:hypothetical protein